MSLAIYAALCLATAATWEPTHDEGTTWNHAVSRLQLAPSEPIPIGKLIAVASGGSPHGPAGVIEALTSADGMHPPAYYLLMNRWIPWTGGRRLLVALPAIALGAAALLSMRRLAARVISSPGAGEWAMALLAVSPWLVGYTVLARPYAMALALVVISSDVLLRSLDAPGRARRRTLYLILSLLGLYTIYHYAFVVAWQIALLAAHAGWAASDVRRREIAALAATIAALCIGYAPWLPHLLAHLELTRAPWYFSGGVALSDWPRAAASLAASLLLGEERGAPGRAALALALVGLAVLTLPLAVRGFGRGRLGSEDAAARAFWWTALLAPAWVAAADAWHGTHTLLIGKTGFAYPPLLVLAVVLAFQGVSARGLRNAGLAAWGVLALAANAAAIARGVAHVSPYEAVARHALERDDPSHLLLIPSAWSGYVYPLLLVLRDAGVERVRLMVAPPEDLRAAGAQIPRVAGVRNVSLVNLLVTYGPGSSWDRTLLREVATRARAEGWKVERVRRDQAARFQNDGERRLWILSPVRVRYFPS